MIKECTIESIAFGGAGVLRHEGLVVFVPFSAPDDLLNVELTQKKKSYALGEIADIISPSLLREDPRCSSFAACGGCQFQHLKYEAELDAKRTFVEDALKRVGGIPVAVPPVIPAPEQWNYRRHIRLNLRSANGGLEAGYIHRNGTTLLPIPQCPLFSEGPILQEVRAFLKELSPEGFEQGSLRIFKKLSSSYMLAFSFSPNLPSNTEKAALKFLQQFPHWDAILFQSPGKKESFGNIHSELDFLGLKIQYSPYGFLQNHPEQSVNLYKGILEMVSPKAENILDLYCGIGISSLLLARGRKAVIGVESHPESIRLALVNSAANSVENARFICGKAEEKLKDLLRTFKPHCIVLNPPRTGLSQGMIENLLQTPCNELIYISCMPSTLARDLKPLIGSGKYEIEKIQPFDMFPKTTHVETIVKIKKPPRSP